MKSFWLAFSLRPDSCQTLLHTLQDVYSLCVPLFRQGKESERTVLNLVALAEPCLKPSSWQRWVQLQEFMLFFGNHWGKYIKLNRTYIFHLTCFPSVCSALINSSQVQRCNQPFSAVIKCSMSEQKLKMTFTSLVFTLHETMGIQALIFRKCQKADGRRDEVTLD